MRAGAPSLYPAFRFRQPPKARPAPAEHRPAAVEPADRPLPLRPAVDLETRLVLRDLGWKP